MLAKSCLHRSNGIVKRPDLISNLHQAIRHNRIQVSYQ